MADPILLYGVGATKAGTSWLYRMLHDRPDCHVHPVKETHYWDSAEARQLEWQVAANERTKEKLRQTRVEAILSSNEKRAANLSRRIAALETLNFMLVQDRRGHAAYRTYLKLNAPAESKVIGEICPAYSLLPVETYAQMAALAPDTRFLYLLRDPLSRLWSAVRMHAVRSQKPGQDLQMRSNQILRAIVLKDKHPQITNRGDYAEILPRLKAGVPNGALRIMHFDDLLTDAGFGALCDWLEISRGEVKADNKVHAGVSLEMNPELRQQALSMLRPQYEAVAEHLGCLPARWVEVLENA
ncbi:MAG: sulfotransferase [Pseudomonadota bacterium]